MYLHILRLLTPIQEQLVDVPSIAHISSKMKKLLLAIRRAAPTKMKYRFGILCLLPSLSPFYLLICICFFNLNLRRRIPVANANCNTSPGCGSIGSGRVPTTGIQGQGNQSISYTLKWINGVKNFGCNFCTKTFNRLGRIISHVRIHTGEKPFKCKICKKRFNQTPNLNRHVLIHAGKRPFSCRVCGKSFTQNANLKRHLQVHTGEKPFECKICKKRFTRKTGLKDHLRTHTGEQPFSCQVCGKSFKYISNLKRHLRQVHTPKAAQMANGVESSKETTEIFPKRQQVRMIPVTFGNV